MRFVGHHTDGTLDTTIALKAHRGRPFQVSIETRTVNCHITDRQFNPMNGSMPRYQALGVESKSEWRRRVWGSHGTDEETIEESMAPHVVVERTEML